MISIFSENSFAEQCFACSCVLCAGIAFACLLRFLFSKKPARQARFTAFCLFLSCAVIFYTILVFMTKNLFYFDRFSLERTNYLAFMAACFVFGMFLAFFWKILLPVSVFFYIFFTIFTLHLLNSLFPPQNAVIPISIEEKTLTIGTQTAERSTDSPQVLKISSYHLSDEFFLPLKRNWFLLGEDSELLDHKICENRLIRFYLTAIVLREKPRPHSISLPEEKIYPSLYSAHISFTNGKMHCELTRDL